MTDRLVQGLTDDQHRQLLTPINPRRVQVANRNSYLEGWDVIAHLNRVFGFGGWDDDVTSEAILFEEHGRDSKNGWYVAYRVALRLTVRSVDGSIITIKTGANTGQADNQPDRGKAHDLAYKAAHTNALKRAASKLGDQFGLSLYDDGNRGTVVGRTLVWTDPTRQQNTDVEQIAADAVANQPPADASTDDADVKDIGHHLATTKPANDPPAAERNQGRREPPAPVADVPAGPAGETLQEAEKRLQIKGKAIRILRASDAFSGLLSLDAVAPDEWADAIALLEVEARKLHAANTRTG
jgi:hypothetical protein